MKLTLFPQAISISNSPELRKEKPAILFRNTSLLHWNIKAMPYFPGALENCLSSELHALSVQNLSLPPKFWKMPLLMLPNLKNKNNKTKSLCFFQYCRHLFLCLPKLWSLSLLACNPRKSISFPIISATSFYLLLLSQHDQFYLQPLSSHMKLYLLSLKTWDSLIIIAIY